jgi:hypothetical protein
MCCLTNLKDNKMINFGCFLRNQFRSCKKVQNWIGFNEGNPILDHY